MVVVAHTALVSVISLIASIIYVLVFVRSPEWHWLLIDGVLAVGMLALVCKLRTEIGFGSLGDRRFRRLFGISLMCTAIVLAAHVVVGDQTGIWSDEANYLATMRAGEILRDGTAPFNIRWLVPFLAGPWNVLATSDVDAFKAVNFASFVVTAVYLVLFLVRLRIRFMLALTAPVFLICSYLGLYGAGHRLLVDPFNYAAYVLILHTLVRRADAPYFSIALLIAAMNSEKAVYWIPVFGMIALFQQARPWALQDVIGAGIRTLRFAAPAAMYFVALAVFVYGSQTDPAPSFMQRLHMMSFTWLSAKITSDTVRLDTFQMLWFPFGAFTIYALLGLIYCERWLRPLVLLTMPIVAQTLIAHDSRRMVAYSFIVVLPLGFVYLDRMLTMLPERLGWAIVASLVVLAVAQSFLLPVLSRVDVTGVPRNFVKLILSGGELALVGSLLFLHLGVFEPDRVTVTGQSHERNR